MRRGLHWAAQPSPGIIDPEVLHDDQTAVGRACPAPADRGRGGVQPRDLVRCPGHVRHLGGTVRCRLSGTQRRSVGLPGRVGLGRCVG